MAEINAWCDRFVLAWLKFDRGSDAKFVRRLARRSYPLEGERVPPEVSARESAREHSHLLRRVKSETSAAKRRR
jgi:hypothetical protein